MQSGCLEPGLEPKSRLEREKTEGPTFKNRLWIWISWYATVPGGLLTAALKSIWSKRNFFLSSLHLQVALWMDRQSNRSIKISLSNSLKDKVLLVNLFRAGEKKRERKIDYLILVLKHCSVTWRYRLCAVNKVLQGLETGYLGCSWGPL